MISTKTGFRSDLIFKKIGLDTEKKRYPIISELCFRQRQADKCRTSVAYAVKQWQTAVA